MQPDTRASILTSLEQMTPALEEGFDERVGSETNFENENITKV